MLTVEIKKIHLVPNKIIVTQDTEIPFKPCQINSFKRRFDVYSCNRPDNILLETFCLEIISDAYGIKKENIKVIFPSDFFIKLGCLCLFGKEKDIKGRRYKR